MPKTDTPLPPALKHGAYSGLKLLPGEDPAEFEKLRNDLFREYPPAGPSEKCLIDSVARLIWRLENLPTYRLAETARNYRWGRQPNCPYQRRFLSNMA
jgi:hypothetical protein